MTKIQFVFIVLVTVSFAAVYCQVNVTPSEQCSNQNFDNLHERVQIIPCGKSRCKLRKGTNITVNFKFKPKYEVKKLTNEVYAKIGVLPLPFIGVNDVSACPQIRRVSDDTPAPCPLVPDQEYSYTNVFFIESFYPTVSLKVHWALNDGKRDVICFEVPAVITPAKNN